MSGAFLLDLARAITASSSVFAGDEDGCSFVETATSGFDDLPERPVWLLGLTSLVIAAALKQRQPIKWQRQNLNPNLSFLNTLVNLNIPNYNQLLLQ